MTKVYTGASMSIDGYIAGPGESGFEHLFKWYGNGDIEIPFADPEMSPHVNAETAKHLRALLDRTGALVVGRKLFDLTNGWGGQHPMGVPVVVLTHGVPDGWEPEGEHFVFVTEGIEAAVAKAGELAGDKVVGVNGGEIAEQCLAAGLLDEIWVDLVPVLLGGGRPFFATVAGGPVVLEGPVSIGDSQDVTHLRYRVVRA